MKRKNKYIKRARISTQKFREIIKLFVIDLNTKQIAFLIGLNRNIVNRYTFGLRKMIAKYCEKNSPFSGEIEVDESYFGPRRIKGKSEFRKYNTLRSVERL